MPKKLKEIPKFKNEDEERAFWAKEDSTDYIDWDKGQISVLPKLKPTTKTISLRMSESMLDQIRLLANQRDVPYQSLIKMFLKERITEELRNG
jgi:predicted DNA binding CopG/RHH family protein